MDRHDPRLARGHRCLAAGSASREPLVSRRTAVGRRALCGRYAMTSTPAPAQSTSLWQSIRQSFMSALGSIVFGMEDGTVSIFGLVFGVAASASDSQTVLLAGA